MKEIDIKGIINKNFKYRMSAVKYKEYPTIYDALHSSAYRKVSQMNFGAIYEGFNVAELEFYYLNANKPIQMRVVFQLSFDFEYAERKKYTLELDSSEREYPSGNKFSVKPRIQDGIDGISIELDELSPINKETYKLLWDNIPHGGGGSGATFRHRCISGMHCEGHRFKHSHVKLDKRIVDFFNYLFGMVDDAYDYHLHPEHKPKIVEVDPSSHIAYDDDYYLHLKY